ncbi:Uncharacterised protein [Escherichia coli]|uniref:Uncharacterized protein n=1 Tax=Escherichia coli TaxID=562 RepID=A0A376KWK8_ECOLX|nr:Uncharacterised protein [Escherichia coli]
MTVIFHRQYAREADRCRGFPDWKMHNNCKPLRIFVFQVCQCLAKHHALAGTVTVDQGELTFQARFVKWWR